MSLSGPSRTIVVEPVERPAQAPPPARREAPPAPPRPAPEREPARAA